MSETLTGGSGCTCRRKSFTSAASLGDVGGNLVAGVAFPLYISITESRVLTGSMKKASQSIQIAQSYFPVSKMFFTALTFQKK